MSRESELRAAGDNSSLAARHSQLEYDLPFVRELGRVAEQIEQYLFNFVGVGVDGGNPGRDVFG